MTALARPRLRRLPLAAGFAGVASLTAALLAGPNGPEGPTLVLAALAGVLLVIALFQRATELMRTGLAAWGLVGGLLLTVIAALWWLLALLYDEAAAAGILISIVGAAIVVIPLVRPDSAWRRAGTPWQTIAGGPTPRARAANALRIWGPTLGGLFLILVGLRVAFETLISVSVGASDALGLMALPLLAVVAITVGGWVVRRVFLGLTPAAEAPTSSANQPSVARDEQVVAAHLHDSVLQTLSLIQRNASDPAKVSQLARQQERSLRSWLAGRDDTAGSTLAGAVRLAAQEVEDEQPGAVIEVVAVGDAQLDRNADAMVRAAREAMRNAVRHAGSPVRVFVEVEEDGSRELFVRDTGGGFDLTAVAEERRGVRDAIIGRMEHVGGTATIDSSPSGTEIALRLPASTADRPA